MLFDEKNCKRLSIDDLDKVDGGYFYYDYDEGFIYVIDRKGEIVGSILIEAKPHEIDAIMKTYPFRLCSRTPITEEEYIKLFRSGDND